MASWGPPCNSKESCWIAPHLASSVSPFSTWRGVASKASRWAWRALLKACQSSDCSIWCTRARASGEKRGCSGEGSGSGSVRPRRIISPPPGGAPATGARDRAGACDGGLGQVLRVRPGVPPRRCRTGGSGSLAIESAAPGTSRSSSFRARPSAHPRPGLLHGREGPAAELGALADGEDRGGEAGTGSGWPEEARSHARSSDPREHPGPGATRRANLGRGTRRRGWALASRPERLADPAPEEWLSGARAAGLAVVEDGLGLGGLLAADPHGWASRGLLPRGRFAESHVTILSSEEWRLMRAGIRPTSERSQRMTARTTTTRITCLMAGSSGRRVSTR